MKPKQRHIFSRLLSAVLAVAMAFSATVSTTFAQSEKSEENGVLHTMPANTVAKSSPGTVELLDENGILLGPYDFEYAMEIMDDYTAGYTIKLATDIAVDSSFSIAMDANFTLDLNGKTLAYTGIDDYFFFLSSGSTVTFKDDTGEGKITSQVQYTIWANGATVVFEGGIYENQNTSNGIAIACNSSNITINDGTFYTTNMGAGGVLIQNSAVTITGGNFGVTGVELKNLTSASISGGNFKSITTSGTGFTKVGNLLAPDHKFVHVIPTILADPTVSTLYSVTVGHIPFDITTSPQSATIAYGASHTLSVEVSNPSGVIYQWYKGIDPLAGATDPSYALPTNLSAGAHVYHCKITYGASTVSTLNVTITVGQKAVDCSLSYTNNLEYGQSASFFVYVDTPDVNGTVYFKEGATTLDKADITSSKRNHTFNNIFPAGENTVTLEFVPSDTNYKTFTQEITFTVKKADQTEFAIKPISAKSYGDPDFDLSTTGGLAGAVTYTSSDPTILEITGSKAKILKAGTVTITATRSGNENYNPATATQEITIGKANTTIAFTPPMITRYFTGEPQANPVNSDLTITGATYDDVVFTWYADLAGTTEISAPTAIGNYWVKATIPETENLKGPVTATTMFEIKQADVFVVILYNGSYAESPWYSQPVTIKHENGFLVSDSPTGTFAPTFTLDGHGAVTAILYFKDTTTGYVSAGVNVSANIDLAPPSFAGDGDGINYGGLNSKTLLTSLSYEVFNTDILVKALAADTESGGVKYFYYVDNNPTTTAKTTAELDALPPFYESSAPTMFTSDGDYVVYAYAMDAVGNKSPYICTNIIRIDKTAPVVKFDHATFVSTSSNISINIKMNETGTIYYVLKLVVGAVPSEDDIISNPNGTINVTSDKINTNFPISFDELTSNTWYRIYAVGVDEAGNTCALNWGEFRTEKLDQPITINPIGAKTYGDADFELSISGGLGDGAVTFTSSDTDILEITGTTAKILKAGTVTITATKAEDDTYAKATTTIDLIINKVSTSIEFNTAEITNYFTGLPQPLPTSDDLAITGASFSDVAFAWYSDEDLNAPIVLATKIGDYWLKATIPETVNFASSFAVQKVTVAFANLNPIIKYNGSETKAEWYNHDVNITADGFTISDSLTGPFQSLYSLSSEGVHTKTLYFKENGTDYISAGKNVSVKIDRTAPSLSITGWEIKATTAKIFTQINETGKIYYVTMRSTATPPTASGIVTRHNGIINVTSDKINTNLTLVVGGMASNSQYVTYAVGVDEAGNIGEVKSHNYVTTKLEQPITINPIGTKTYGDADFNLSISGGLGSGAVTFTSSDTDILQITGNTAKIKKAGTVAITAIKLEDEDYYGATTTLDLTIAKKALTITADDITITKGGVITSPTYTVIGLANGDLCTSADLSLTADLHVIATYPIIISDAVITNAENYDITYVNGKLEVVGNPHAVTVTDGTGGGTYREGQTVSITANNRTGFTFKDWTAEGVTLSSPTSKTITFTMPDNAVTLTANYTANATSGGTTGGGGGYTPSTPTTPSTVTSTVGVSDTNAAVTVSGSVASVTYGDTVLIAGKDYTITNGQLVIKTEVLAELSSFGEVAEVEIILTNGQRSRYSIRRTDTPRLANPVETSTAITFNFAGYGHNPRTIQLLQGSNVVTELRIISDFNTKDGKLTLNKKAIASLEDGSYTFTVGFDTGASLNLTLIKKGSQITIVRSDLNRFSVTGGKAPSSLDCLKMLEMYVADKSSTGENFDLNADGKFDTQDILLLLEFVVS